MWDQMETKYLQALHCIVMSCFFSSPSPLIPSCCCNSSSWPIPLQISHVEQQAPPSLPQPPSSSSSNKIVTPITISSCPSIAEFFILRRRRLTERCNNLWRRGAFSDPNENLQWKCWKKESQYYFHVMMTTKASASWILFMLLLWGPRSSIRVVTTPRSAKWRRRAGRLNQEDRGFQSLAASKRTIL